MKNTLLPILVVEDDAELREAIVVTLELAHYSVLTACDGSNALQVLANKKVGLIISDVQMQPMDGHQLLIEVKQRYPKLPLILMTAYGMIDKAVQAIKAGACNYLTKPFEPARLLDEVTRTMLPALPEDENTEIIRHDPLSIEVYALASRVAATETTVLITGESGTGKEVMARYLHAHSPRKHGPFVAINCAAIPDSLLESLLFGYEKGAFSGASKSQAGKFEQAQGGTLLLDEVSEMPMLLQAKMLRVLQEREVERLGGERAIKLDLRILATSNRDMQKSVAEGRFREDLFYRLSVFPIELPSLRARALDIIPLANHVLQRFAAQMQVGEASFSKEAQQALQQHAWPGNIRELENVVQRSLILANGQVIEAKHLSLRASPVEIEKNAAKIAASNSDVLEPAAEIAASEAPPSEDLKSLERNHILSTLKNVGGVRKKAAEKLRMSERTLRYKLHQYKLDGFITEE